MLTQFRWASPRLNRRSDVGDCELWRWQVQLVYWNGGKAGIVGKRKIACQPWLFMNIFWKNSNGKESPWMRSNVRNGQKHFVRRKIWNLAELGSQGSAEFYCCRGTNLISRFGSELSADCKQFQQKSRNGEISICIDL